MSAGRRAAWFAVPALWALIAAFKTIWHPTWGDDLFDWGAVASVALAVLTGLRLPRGVPQLSERRTRRQVAELAARMATVEKGLAQTQAQRSEGIEALTLALDKAGVPVPDCLAADAPTQPVIRVIGRRAG